jgi:hypothetical protein
MFSDCHLGLGSAAMLNALVLTVASIPNGSPEAGGSFVSQAFTVLSAIAWVVTLVLIVIAVRANWGIAKHMPNWAVTLTLVAIGALVLVAFVSHTGWVAIAALIAVFASWLWLLARWLFPRIPKVHEEYERVAHPELAAEQDAARAASSERGAALEHVLDDMVHEEHPDDLKAVQED